MVHVFEQLREQLHTHELLLVAPVFAIRPSLIDGGRSKVELRGSSALRCEIAAVRDERLPFYFAFSRPRPGHYAFGAGRDVAFADWDPLATDSDVAERKYEVSGLLRSRVLVRRTVNTATGALITERYEFSALSYRDQGPHVWTRRHGYALWARVETVQTEHLPWLEA